MIPALADTHTPRINGYTTDSDVLDRMSISAPSTGDVVANPEIELIFLGTGTSSSVPLVGCLTAPPDKDPCKTCLATLTPEGKKNIRRNTSAVIRVTTGNDGKKKTVVIDVGKNFQAAAVEWFPKYGLREIDAVLITHAHADAMNGLDDLRGWTLGRAIQDYIDVYVSEETFRQVQRSFPYLVSKEFASGGGDVPDFKWHIIEDGVPFEIKDTGIRVTPFSVHHGRLFSSPAALTPTPFSTQPPTPRAVSPAGRIDGGSSLKIYPYLCFGFLVEDAIVYMSDVSFIPEEAWRVIEAGGEKLVLVVDCLRLERHTSHMGVREAAAVIRRAGARRSYMTGFGHSVPHEEYVRMGEGCTEGRGAELMREGLAGSVRWVRPAHDGLRIVVRRDGPWDETYG